MTGGGSGTSARFSHATSSASGARVGTAWTAFHSIAEDGAVWLGPGVRQSHAAPQATPTNTAPSTTTAGRPRFSGPRAGA